jgi:hypothetical protein
MTIPSVEIVSPMCPCTREIGKYQYDMCGQESFKNFLKEFNIRSEYTPQTPKNLMMCCKAKLQYPRFACLPKIQMTDAQRIYPTSLQGSLISTKTIEWYGKVPQT